MAWGAGAASEPDNKLVTYCSAVASSANRLHFIEHTTILNCCRRPRVFNMFINQKSWSEAGPAHRYLACDGEVGTCGGADSYFG